MIVINFVFIILYFSQFSVSFYTRPYNSCRDISLYCDFDPFNSDPFNKPISKRKTKSKIKYIPRSDNQRKYVQCLEDDYSPLIFGLGPAGTGKTLFACQVGITALKSKQFDKIVITRPLVSVERENVGFLPGNIKEKMDPWTRPIIDMLCEILSKEDVESMIRKEVIEISPLAYMRGRTFKNSWIIADEMQNSSPNQMKMLTTRIGEGSKMIVNGDLNQSDLDEDNGLSDLLQRVKDFQAIDYALQTDNLYNTTFDTIHIVEMNDYDIQRSPIVSKLMRIYSPTTQQVLRKPIYYQYNNNNDTTL